jgi:hypothetical protein
VQNLGVAADPERGAKHNKPRLLASRSEQGYTSSANESLREEPEAISSEEQRQLTAAVHRAERERLRREWQHTEQQIGDELDHFVYDAGVRPDRRIVSSVRAVRRAARAVGRRVEAEQESA